MPYSSEDIVGYSWISDLKVDSQQNVWISLSGYYPVDFHTGGIVKFDGEEWTVFSSEETGHSLNSYFLAIDQTDKLWVTSNSNTIVAFDGQDFEAFSTIVSNTSMNPSAVTIDEQNVVWIGTNRGLERLGEDGFEKINIAFPEKWLLERLAVKSDHKANQIWFKSLNGLVSFDGMGWSYLPFENEMEIFKNGFGSVVSTTDGSFWNISQDKIYQCVNGNCINHEPFSIEAQHGRVNDGMEDREGNLWFVVDRRQRLIRFDGTEWTDFTQTMTEAYLNIQNGTSIYALTFDLDNNLWIGTTKGKLHKWNGEKWKTFDLQSPQDYSYKPIHDLVVDKNNQIWVAHQDHLKLFDGEQVVADFTSQDLGIIETNFWNVTIDPNNHHLWVGTARAGVLRYDGNEWKSFHSLNSPLIYNSIDHLLIDPKGHKWIVPQYGGFDIFREEGVVPFMTAPDPDDEEETHPDYSTGENIPNPFSESTRIPIELTEASWVEITVFNHLGQVVTSFKREQMLAGKHYFDFDGTQLKPNVYYYTLETNKGKTTGKMLKR